jgi:succinylglutamate desuccinylase
MTSDLRSIGALRRELGTWDCGHAGPTLLVLAGIHGNEPAGVLALQRVLGRLQELDLDVRGRLVALAGNLPALARGVRYVARDLNRGWLPDATKALRARDPDGLRDEDAEQRELLAAFDRALLTTRGPVVFVDLHTSSADGPPFLCLADTSDNRRLGLATGVPLILGIEETIDGASLEYFSQRGVVCLAVEGGRHEHPDTASNHEALLWLLLERLGILRPGQIDTAPFRAQIARVTSGLPRAVEIVSRHVITAEDRFVMRPGFTNFQPVHKGQPLATDRNGDVLAPAACRVMLPLYQPLGDDGFFLARDVRPIRLRVTAIVRRLRLDAIVHWLPGVHRDPGDRNTLIVDPHIARWFVRAVFRLLGFRKARRVGDKLSFTRRWSLRENARLGR